MSLIESFSEPIWQRWALALCHFLWQGLAVSGLLALAVNVLGVRRAGARYAASLAALCVLTLCPPITFLLVEAPFPPARAGGAQGGAESRASAGGAASREEAGPAPLLESDRLPAAAGEAPAGAAIGSALRETARSLQPWAMALWLAGVAALGARLAVGLAGLVRLERLRRPVPAALAARARELAQALGLSRAPRLFALENAGDAAAAGFFRPVVLLPLSWMSGLPAEVLEAVIAHELAHIRRFDLWVNLFQRVVETTLFFHPAVWWLSDRLRREREMCCDELACAATGERLGYATALEQLARRRLERLRLALLPGMGGSGSYLLERVRNVLGLEPSPRSSGWWLAGVLSLAAPFSLWMATASGGAEPRVEDAPPPRQAASDSARELEEVRKLYQALPRDFRESGDLKKATRDVQECRRRSEGFLSRFPGTPGEEEAQLILGRLLFNLNRVAWTDLVAEENRKGTSNSDILKKREPWAKAYFGRILDLARAALPRLPAGSTLRARCFDLLAGAYLQRGELAKALERYGELLKEFPSYEDRAAVYQGMAQAHQDQGTYAEGIAVIRKAMAELPDDPSLPYFEEWLWKLYSAAGDLPGLLDVVEEARRVLPARARREKTGRVEKEACERIHAYSGFRQGYVRFALGDLEGAKQAFHEHVDYLDAQAMQKGSVAPDLQVFRGRSSDNLAVLESKIGKPTGADLGRVIWAGQRSLILDGRPLALVFRTYDDERSAPFLQALDRRARESKGAFEAAAISFLKPVSDPLDQAALVRAEARALELECPVGLDPDARDKGLFRAFGATVGSATFVIVDRSGNYVWFQQDPRPVDVKFSLKILDRIVSSR